MVVLFGTILNGNKMISKEILKNCLFFDVETAGCAPDYSTLQKENPRLAKLFNRRYKYYQGMAEFQNASIDEVFLGKAGLEPEYAKVVCVSFGTIFVDTDGIEKPRLVSFYGENEKEILEKSNKVFSNASAKGMKLCGHNIKGFDVPCLGKRMLYNSIEPSKILSIWDKKPWEVPYLDTSEIFAFGSWSQQKYLSLDLLACSLGVDSPKEDIDGSQVHKTFWGERDYEKIKIYCEKDVETVMNVLGKVSH